MGGRSAGGDPQAGLLPRDSQARAGASPSSGGTCQNTWLYTFALGRTCFCIRTIRRSQARAGASPSSGGTWHDESPCHMFARVT